MCQDWSWACCVGKDCLLHLMLCSLLLRGGIWALLGWYCTPTVHISLGLALPISCFQNQFTGISYMFWACTHWHLMGAEEVKHIQPSFYRKKRCYGPSSILRDVPCRVCIGGLRFQWGLWNAFCIVIFEDQVEARGREWSKFENISGVWGLICLPLFKELNMDDMGSLVKVLAVDLLMGTTLTKTHEKPRCHSYWGRGTVPL